MLDASSLDPPTIGRGNLPAPITSFVGRLGELEEISRALEQCRLVTLSGVGGVGKTRLALQAAAELSPRFPDGVWVVELASLADPALLPHTIVDSLGIAQRSARDPMATLTEFLRRRRVLLILDNCEHLLDRAAEVVDGLLRAADRLHVVTTSRQRLGVTGEIVVRLAPLEVPPSGEPLSPEAGQYNALRLFAERAAAVVPGFVVDGENVEAVTRVCQRLEGLPLALELAAVRLRVLPIDELAARLEDRFALLVEGGRTAPARHRTLRATVDWSYELCTRDEQLLWARCAIFSGTFDLGAVEAVCSDDDLPTTAVLDTLASLVDKSILIAEQVCGARFRMLETIREYGLARLGEAGVAPEFRGRHCAWYLRLVAAACAEWFGPEQGAWCERLRLEQPNLRAAIDVGFADGGDTEGGLELVGRPWFLWVCLFRADGRHWLDRALDSTTAPSVHRSRALATAAYIASLQGDRAAADTLLDEGAASLELIHDPETAAYLLHVRGVYALFFGESAECGRLLTAALAEYDGLPIAEDLRVVAQIQLSLSLIFLGDLTTATALLDECRTRCQEAGEEWLLSYALYGLGLARFAAGELTAAADFIAQSLQIKRVFGDSLGLAMALDLIAWIRAEQGANAPAATLLGAAAHLWHAFGVELFGSSHWLAHRRRCEERTRAALGSAYEAAVELGANLSIDDALSYAFAPPGPLALGHSAATALTVREREVAVLVANGLANRAIATELHVSQRTAETHVQHILTKLGFQSRAQIANWVGERRGRAEDN
ncbi:MAG: ATP-binding protein [Sporichthyaceae bacterium]